MENKTMDYICDLLISTGRTGMRDLIACMKDNGFFAAPCSGSNHLAKEGGLAEHSVNVYEIMKDTFLCMLPEKGTELIESVIICSLLHDLGKMGDYGKPNYVPNMIKSRKKNENGEYPLVQSETKPFEVNKELLYIPHEVRSVVIAERYIHLTEEEEQAILWHNGLYGEFRYDIQGKETPLYLLLHFADMWASRVVEVKNEI